MEELQLIRETLVKTEEPETTEEAKKKRGFGQDFIDFIQKYKVMGAMVAFIMALYIGELAKALVNDIILAPLGYFPRIGEWATYELGPFMIGHFVNTLIVFLLVTFVVYLIVKITSKLGIEDKK